MYMQVSDVKLLLHNSFADNEYNYISFYSKLIQDITDILIEIKDKFNYISLEFRDIVSTNNNLELSIYGNDTMKLYKFYLNNILNFFINFGINLLKFYNYLLSEEDLNLLTYGYTEFLDMENKTYLFY